MIRQKIFCLIIVIGFVSNSLVIAFVKMFRSMRTTTNYRLVNVACAEKGDLSNDLSHQVWRSMIYAYKLTSAIAGLN